MLRRVPMVGFAFLALCRFCAGSGADAAVPFFSDPFSPAVDGAAGGRWRVIRGSFEVAPLILNKDWAFRSINPWAYLARPAPDAAALADRPPARDGAFSVAFKAGAGVSAGQFLRFVDERNHLLLRCGPARGGVAYLGVVRRAAGAETLLGGASVPVEPDSWTRLRTVLSGSAVLVLKDGAAVLRAVDPAPAEGRVGLSAEGGEVLFDDAAFEAFPAAFADFSGPPPWNPVPDPKFWTVVADGAGRSLRKARPGPSLSLCEGALPETAAYTLDVRLDPGSSAGVVLGSADAPGSSWAAMIARGTGADRAAIGRFVAGRMAAVADVRLEPAGGRAQRIEVVREGRFVRLRRDGRPVLEEFLPGEPAGRAGIFADGTGVRLLSFSAAPWERPRTPWMPQTMVLDPEMKHQWAHPAWGFITTDLHPKRPNAVPLAEYKGLLFRDFELDVPFAAAGAGRLVFSFGGADSGCRAVCTRAEGGPGVECSVFAGERRLAAGTAAAGPSARLGVVRRGRLIFLRVDDVPVVAAALAPDCGRASGEGGGASLRAEGGVSIDYGGVRVRTPDLLDYTFDEAPADWYAGMGEWRIVNRWTCTPNWNWLGSAGEPAASLWNKRTFSGDICVEYSAAFRMNAAEGGRYRVGTDLNLTICGDGRNVSSGYSFIVGGWGNTRTAILREGRVVAESRAPGHLLTLFTDGPWSTYNWHHKWWQVRARKTGARLQLFVDNDLACEWTDPAPLAGGRVALWTYDNLVSYPRVLIHREGEPAPPCSPAPPARPREAVLAASAASAGAGAPGFGFEDGTQGWTGSEGADAVEVGLSAETPDGSRAALCLFNRRGGGRFTAKAPLGVFDAADRHVLAFDYRLSPGAKANLLLTCGETPCEIGFSAPERVSDTRLRLGAVPGVLADGRWRRAAVDLRAFLRAAFPRAAALRVKDLMFGLDTAVEYALAGFGGNPAGSFLLLDNVSLGSGGSAVLSLAAPRDPSAWDGGPVAVRLGEAGASADPAFLEYGLGGAALRGDSAGVSFDPASATVRLDPAAAGCVFRNGETVLLSVRPAGGPGGGPAPLSRSLTFQGTLDRTGPSAPRIILPVESLCADDFERDAGRWTAREGAVAARDPSSAASGRYALRIFGPRSQTPFAASAWNAPFNGGRWRFVGFDYRIGGELRADVLVRTGGAVRSVRFADGDGVRRMGDPGPIERDGRWHRRFFDLHPMLAAADPTARNYEIADLSFGDTGHLGNVQGQRWHVDDFRIDAIQRGAEGLRVRFEAGDPSGIAGYAWSFDTSDATAPETTRFTESPEVLLRSFPAPVFFVHARALDRAGNWGAVSHRRVAVDAEPPAASAGAPAGRSCGPVVSLPLSDRGAAGVDPATVRLEIDGTVYDTANPGLVYDAARGVLSFDAEKAAPAPVVFPDGREVAIALRRAEDCAGNPAASLPSWRFTMDYRLDTTGPAIASVEGNPHRLLRWDDFERDAGQTADAGTGGLLETARRTDGPGGYAGFRMKADGSLAARLLAASFDVRQSPALVFRYRFSPGAAVDLALVGPGNEHLTVRMTGSGGEAWGSVEGASADGRWHTAVVDMQAVFDARAKARRLAGFAVSAILLKGAAARAGTSLDVDDVIVATPGPAAGALAWKATDATGIAGYRCAIDRESATEPGPDGERTAASFPLAGLPAGLSFLHVRARDGAGNWGPTTHHPVVIR